MTIQELMPYWKEEEKCYEEAKLEGKDRNGKKVSTHWPRDKPQEQLQYEEWLKKVKDPDTGKFYEQRDKNGNTVKGTGPKYQVRRIVRIKLTDGTQWLYSHGNFTGFDSSGDVVSVHCQGRGSEIWTRTHFAYRKQVDEKTVSIKRIVEGPSTLEQVYELAFNEKNLKNLFEKRMNDKVSFILKDETHGNAVREVKDQTNIASKTLELFMKPWDYLWEAKYLSVQTRAELRQYAIDNGLIPGGKALGGVPGDLGQEADS